MKSLKIAIILILLLNGVYSLSRWLSTDTPESTGYEQSQLDELPPPPQAAEGLNLQALTTITKEIRSGQELERRLNEKDGINNLDLNDDQKVDYIQVSEFGDVKNKIGYSLTVEPEKNQTQEIATVEIEKIGDRAEIQVVGNEQIYGPESIYNDWAPIEREKSAVQTQGTNTAPMYSSYFYPRPLWISPFYFGFYPPYYSFFPIMGRSMYMGRMNSVVHSSVNRGYNQNQKSSNRKISNPNSGKTANKGIKRSLKKPTSTQKKFTAQSHAKKTRSGGFGKGRSGSRNSGVSSSRTTGTSRSKNLSTRQGRSFNTTSKSGLGKSRSGFGGGSVRSGGFRSRSFSFGGK